LYTTDSIFREGRGDQILPTFALPSGVEFHARKTEIKNFPCDILSIEDNIKNYVSTIPIVTSRTADFSPSNNIVLWVEYELLNILGVRTAYQGKVIFHKVKKNSF